MSRQMRLATALATIGFLQVLFSLCVFPTPLIATDQQSATTLSALGTAASPVPKVDYQDGKLSVQAEQADLIALLRRIGWIAGIGVEIGEGVKGTVNVQFQGLTLEEGVKRILEAGDAKDFAAVFEKPTPTSPLHLSTISVVRKGVAGTSAAPDSFQWPPKKKAVLSDGSEIEYFKGMFVIQPGWSWEARVKHLGRLPFEDNVRYIEEAYPIKKVKGPGGRDFFYELAFGKYYLFMAAGDVDEVEILQRLNKDIRVEFASLYGMGKESTVFPLDEKGRYQVLDKEELKRLDAAIENTNDYDESDRLYMEAKPWLKKKYFPKSDTLFRYVTGKLVVDVPAKQVKDVQQLENKILRIANDYGGVLYSRTSWGETFNYSFLFPAVRGEEIFALRDKLIRTEQMRFIIMPWDYRILRSSDPYVQYQSNLTNIDAEAAWNYWSGTSPSAHINVAVVDSGIGLDGNNNPHQDFYIAPPGGNNTLQILNDADFTGTGMADTKGHGTMVAGIIAAVGNNGIGIDGAAYSQNSRPLIDLVPVKFTTDSGGDIDQDRLKASLRYLYAIAGPVVNLSFGLDLATYATQELKTIYELGGVLVTAGPNSNDACPKDTHKRLTNQWIAKDATAFDKNMPDTRSLFDRILYVTMPNGACANSMLIDVAGPGIDILSLRSSSLASLPPWAKYCREDQGYMCGSGTSFSTPHVSALAAMILAMNGGTQEKAYSAITQWNSALPPYAYYNLDMLKSVQNVATDSTPPDPPSGLKVAYQLDNYRTVLTWDPPPSGDPNCSIRWKVYRNDGMFETGRETFLCYSKTNELEQDDDMFVGGKAFFDYYYRVTAVDCAGNESASTEAIRFAGNLPGPPSDLLATRNPIDKTVSLTWSAPPNTPDLAGYKVYYDDHDISDVAHEPYTGQGLVGGDSPIVTGSLAPSFVMDGPELRAGATYYVTVAAVNTDGNESSYSNPIVIDTPKEPTGLTASDNPADASVELSWLGPTLNTDNKVLKDLEGYRVYHDTDNSGPPYDNVFFVASPCTAPLICENMNTFMTELTPNSTYYVAVTAVDLDENESAFSSGMSFSTFPPQKPTGLVLVGLLADGTADIQWIRPTMNANATPLTHLNGYYVYHWLDGQSIEGAVKSELITPSGATVDAYSITGLESQKAYHITVSAVGIIDNESEIADEIVVADNTPLPPSGLIALANAEDNSITLTWNTRNPDQDPIPISKYVIYRSISNGSYEFLDNVNAFDGSNENCNESQLVSNQFYEYIDRYQDDSCIGLNLAHVYEYQVFAVDVAGNWSMQHAGAEVFVGPINYVLMVSRGSYLNGYETDPGAPNPLMPRPKSYPDTVKDYIKHFIAVMPDNSDVALLEFREQVFPYDRAAALPIVQPQPPAAQIESSSTFAHEKLDSPEKRTTAIHAIDWFHQTGHSYLDMTEVLTGGIEWDGENSWRQAKLEVSGGSQLNAMSQFGSMTSGRLRVGILVTDWYDSHVVGHVNNTESPCDPRSVYECIPDPVYSEWSNALSNLTSANLTNIIFRTVKENGDPPPGMDPVKYIDDLTGTYDISGAIDNVQYITHDNNTKLYSAPYLGCRETLLNQTYQVGPGEHLENAVEISADVSNATIMLYGTGLTHRLFRPDGTPVELVLQDGEWTSADPQVRFSRLSGSATDVFHLLSPQPGKWKVEVDGTALSARAWGRAVALGTTETRIKLALPKSVRPGESFVVSAMVAGQDLLATPEVTMRMTRPGNIYAMGGAIKEYGLPRSTV